MHNTNTTIGMKADNIQQSGFIFVKKFKSKEHKALPKKHRIAYSQSYMDFHWVENHKFAISPWRGYGTLTKMKNSHRRPNAQSCYWNLIKPMPYWEKVEF